jgi:hypothetical protein
MDEYETPEVETDIDTPEEDDGSFLTTGIVFGAGTLAGIGLTRLYGKVKDTVQIRLAERRAAQTQEIPAHHIETTATEAE